MSKDFGFWNSLTYWQTVREHLPTGSRWSRDSPWHSVVERLLRLPLMLPKDRMWVEGNTLAGAVSQVLERLEEEVILRSLKLDGSRWVPSMFCSKTVNVWVWLIMNLGKMWRQGTLSAAYRETRLLPQQLRQANIKAIDGKERRPKIWDEEKGGQRTWEPWRLRLLWILWVCRSGPPLSVKSHCSSLVDSLETRQRRPLPLLQNLPPSPLLATRQ